MTDDERDAALAKHREFLAQTIREQAPHFDKLVLALSGGGIGFSVTLVTALGERLRPEGLPWLWATWGLLALSLATLLGSVLAGILGAEHGVRQIDAGAAASHRKKFGGVAAQLVDPLNIAAAITCILGMLTLFGFAAHNYRATEAMGLEKAQPASSEKKGLPVIGPPKTTPPPPPPKK